MDIQRRCTRGPAYVPLHVLGAVGACYKQCSRERQRGSKAETGCS
jgi:hypothetical protein